MSAPALLEVDAAAARSATAREEQDDGPFANRFLLVTVACRRVVQICSGSRIRVLARGHKPVVIAVAEVRAGSVPYSLM